MRARQGGGELLQGAGRGGPGGVQLFGVGHRLILGQRGRRASDGDLRQGREGKGGRAAEAVSVRKQKGGGSGFCEKTKAR
jgi:hypothetical protein